MPIHNALTFEHAGQRPSPRGLQTAGPILAVEVSLHPRLVEMLQQRGHPVPSPVAGTGLMDTGATVTAIDAAVLGQLRIPPVGAVRVGTAGGQQTQSLHPAMIRFPEIGVERSFTSTIGADLSGQGIIVLIGRDVLRRALFVYNGTLGHFILSF